MKGTVLDFSIQSNSGVISGDDNQRYTFAGQEWNDNAHPARGIRVDFAVDDSTGQAVAVYRALGNDQRHQSLSQSSNHQDEENFNLVDWTKKCFSNYANFTGRARRKEFWYFYLATILIGLVVQLFDAILDSDPLLIGIWNLAIFLPVFAAGARRLHDTGRSGWWQLLVITVIGVIPLIIFLALDTKPENNKWGAPAK